MVASRFQCPLRNKPHATECYTNCIAVGIYSIGYVVKRGLSTGIQISANKPSIAVAIPEIGKGTAGCVLTWLSAYLKLLQKERVKIGYLLPVCRYKSYDKFPTDHPIINQLLNT